MQRAASAVLTVLVIGVVATGAYYAGQHRKPAAAPETVAAAAPAPSPEAPAPATPATPAIAYPMEAVEAAGPAVPALVASDTYVSNALAEWLGRKNVQTFLHLDGFARRVVATTDNLAREHAAPALWPVAPMPGRFATLLADGRPAEAGSPAATSINPDNGQRYTPFVLFIESIDTPQAVRLYARLYPLFQQAYEELGFPGRYFNDRLVAVIDHLLATPVQAAPLAVSLVEVKGPVPSVQPWVRYEFTDPALKALSAGQKMLLRTGPANHQRLKAKLMEVRRLVSGSPLAPAAGIRRP
jgi:hypothetical protein